MLALSNLLVSHTPSAEPQNNRSQILTTTLSVPQLGRQKRIWIYLPPGYGTDGNRRFPVIYMQDGQYLFERLLHPSVSALVNEALNLELQRGIRWYGNWQVDKRLDRLFAEKETDGFIIIGISNDSGNRTAEYSPWSWSGAPVPEGDQYVAFIVQTLKPYVDDNYLTLSGRDDTAIAGSSLGGLIALYGGLKYPHVFSKIAAFSPVLTSHVFGKALREYIRRKGKLYAMRIYVDLGSEELGFGPLEPVYESLRAAGFLSENLWFRHIPKGEHRVEHWGRRFPDALLWLYCSELSRSSGNISAIK